MDTNALLQELSERLDRLEAENERLRSALEARDADVHEDPHEPVIMSRRNWLARGAAVAAGAVVGGAALSAHPVAALNGPLLMDSNNSATNSTTIHANRGTDLFDAVFGATNDNGTQGTGVFGYGSTFGIAGHSAFGTGVWGKASGDGSVPAVGVQGYIDNDLSPNSIGVLGDAGGAAQIGVKGSSSVGTGVRADSTSGSALVAISGSGRGVLGTSTSNTGVEGSSTTGWSGYFHGGRTDLLLGNANRTNPTLDGFAHEYGELVAENHSDVFTSTLWYTVKAVPPSNMKWRRLAGPDTAGALTVLALPVRVYDTRPGQPPLVGVKSPLAKDTDRSVDCTANSSGVPTDAVAVLLNVTVANPTAAGNVSVRAAGAGAPTTSNLNFVAGQTIANSVTSACGAGATVALRLGGSTLGMACNAIVDVVGYYR